MIMLRKRPAGSRRVLCADRCVREVMGWKRLGDLGPGDALVAGLLVGAGELLPGGHREIDVVAKALRAQVHDGSNDSAALEVGLDLLSTPWVAGFTGHPVVGGFTPGGLCERNDEHGVVELLTASTVRTRLDVVDGSVTGELAGTAATVGRWAGWRCSWGCGRRCGRRSWGRCSAVSGWGRRRRSWCGSWGWLRFDRLGLLDGLGLLNGLWLLGYRGWRRGWSRGRSLGRRNVDARRHRRRCRRRRSVGRRLGGAGRNHGAGDLGRLRGGCDRGVVVDGGVDHHGLDNDLGLVDEIALVQRRSNGQGAEEHGGEDG